MSDEKHKAFKEWAIKAGYPQYDFGRYANGLYYIHYVEQMYKAYCARDNEIAEMQAEIDQLKLWKDKVLTEVGI